MKVSHNTYSENLVGAFTKASERKIMDRRLSYADGECLYKRNFINNLVLYVRKRKGLNILRYILSIFIYLLKNERRRNIFIMRKIQLTSCSSIRMLAPGTERNSFSIAIVLFMF